MMEILRRFASLDEDLGSYDFYKKIKILREALERKK